MQHMLFLGTEKFPEENSYDAYIASHNGNMNAYTSSDHSLYHFEVAPAALEGGLERFSWFFRGALFNESCVEREQNGEFLGHRKIQLLAKESRGSVLPFYPDHYVKRIVLWILFAGLISAAPCDHRENYRHWARNARSLPRNTRLLCA